MIVKNSEKLFLFFLSFYFQVELEGLLGGGDLGDLANEAVSEMIPGLLEELKPEFLPYINEQVIELANGLLEGVTLQDILDLISGGGTKEL
jgi:Haemolymph juvenile hormone binding protein (JHBP).